MKASHPPADPVAPAVAPLPLSAELEPETTLVPEWSWTVRERATGERLVLKRCQGAALELDLRLRKLRQGRGIVLERRILEEGGSLYTVRPFVEGRPLEEVRDLGFEDKVGLVLGALSDLSTLHRCGVAHGNLHAGNVIVESEGRARIVDCLDLRSASRPPQRGGASLRAAPEQLLGAGPSVRADVYCVGLLAFELVAGRPAFRHADWLELVRRALYEEPVFSSREEKELLAPLVACLRTALERDPSKRYSSAARMAEALRTTLPSRLPSIAAGDASRKGPRTLGELGLRARPWFSQQRARVAERAVEAQRRWRTLPRMARTALPVALAGIVLGAAALNQLSYERTLERKVARLLANHDAGRARSLLLAERSKRGESSVIEKLLGDVSCARGQVEDCLRRYRSALEASSRHASDETLRRNALSLLGRDDRQGLLAAVLARLESIEPELVADTRNEQYWRRWTSVRALEARGAQGRIDYAGVYSLDVRHAASCSTRRAALFRLVEMGAAEALPSLREAAEEARRRRDTCLEDELPRAIGALESGR